MCVRVPEREREKSYARTCSCVHVFDVITSWKHFSSRPGDNACINIRPAEVTVLKAADNNERWAAQPCPTSSLLCHSSSITPTSTSSWAHLERKGKRNKKSVVVNVLPKSRVGMQADKGMEVRPHWNNTGEVWAHRGLFSGDDVGNAGYSS